MQKLLTLLAVVFASQSIAHAQFVHGVDVSHWQGNVNWTNLKNAGVQFAFAKATEGVDFVDIKFHQNMANARAAGVWIGPYHYARPDSFENDPQDAAKEALAATAGSLRDLRVAEVSKLDITLTADGKIEAFRAKLSVSFKYEQG